MAPIETQQLWMLEQLRQPGRQPVTLDQLRAGGIDFPAVVIRELELNGYVIDRVYSMSSPPAFDCLRPKPTRARAAVLMRRLRPEGRMSGLAR